MKKILIYLTLLANFIILFCTWYYFSGGLLQTSNLGNTFIGLGKLCGLLATNLVLLQLILIGRVKWVESIFGLDKLSNIHRLNGYVILGIIILHPLLITQGYSTMNETTYLGQYMDFLQNWDELLKAAIGFFVFLGTIILSITIVRKKLKYETWYYVHLFNYIAIALIFGHQLRYGTSIQSDNFQIYWYSLYIIAFGNLLWFRFISPVIKFYKFRFEVEKVELLNNATSIYIKGRSLEELKIEAGQFMIVRFLQKGFIFQAHPFSLSVAPNSGHTRITAKELGDYTSTLKNIAVGTKVFVDGPHGVFTKAKTDNNKLLFIAGGIGITPIRSLLEEFNDSCKDLLLLYSNKTEADILLKNEVDELGKTNPNLQIRYVLSGEDQPGFINGPISKELLSNLVTDLMERDVYLCGPPPMMEAIRQALIESGVPKKRVFFEKFSL